MGLVLKRTIRADDAADILRDSYLLPTILKPANLMAVIRLMRGLPTGARTG